MEAEWAFEEDMAVLARAMADDVAGRVSSKAPDVQLSAEALGREIRNHYEPSGVPIPLPIADTITLSQNLASIAAPLYADIPTHLHQPPSCLDALPPDQAE